MFKGKSRFYNPSDRYTELPGGPGEYEYTIHPQKDFNAWVGSPGHQEEPPGELTRATLRKVGDVR